jgi:hypothetical protein
MWHHHYAPEGEHQDTEWKHLTTSQKEVKSSGKVMLTLFWGARQPVLERY